MAEAGCVVTRGVAVVGWGLTVTVQVAFTVLPATEAVITAVPGATALTTPVVALTVATADLLVDQVIVLFVAFVGLTVAVSVKLVPTMADFVVALRVTLFTATVAATTVIESCLEVLPAEFVATTEKLYVPAVVGVPAMMPLAESLSPPGRGLPALSDQVMGVSPVATRVWE